MENKTHLRLISNNSILSDYENKHDSIILDNLYQIQYRKNLFLKNILINKSSNNPEQKNNAIQILSGKKSHVQNNSNNQKKLFFDHTNNIGFLKKKNEEDYLHDKFFNQYLKNNTVYNYLFQFTGFYFTQSELIYLRKTFFQEILPPATRDEQRSKIKNIQSIESYSEKIMPLLQNPEIQDSIQKYILYRRT